MLMKMRHQMKKGRNQKGFTLVELMVVVVIIGILSAIAVPVYNNVTERAERSAVEANLRTIDGAIMTYYASEASPEDLESVEELKNKGYLASVPDGPGTGTVYGIYGTAPQQTATVKSTKVGGKEISSPTTLKDLTWGGSSEGGVDQGDE